MPYVVLARKWRPQRFEEVVGQRHVTGTLVNAIKAGRLANAYLFSGPRGVGKTTVARILAKAINCDQGPTPEPCNQCPPCVEITEGRSLDVLEIDGASNRGVDEVRNLRENIRYAAAPGKSRIYIIDEVHMLTTEAFNALLKTLEEPPPRVVFISATTEPHKVPPTILSRCQRFEFHRLPVELIVEQLRRICEAEGIQAEEEALRMIAVKADGSMRDAESLLDQVVSFSGGQVARENVAELVGVVDREFLVRLGDAILSSDVRQAVELAREAHLRGYDFNEFLQACAEYFRDLLVIRSAGAETAEVPESYLETYERQAGEFSEEDLLRLIKIASDGAYRIHFTPNPRVRFEVTLVRMAKLLKSADLVELLRQVGTDGPAVSGLERPSPRGSRERPAAASPARKAGSQPASSKSRDAQSQSGPNARVSRASSVSGDATQTRSFSTGDAAVAAPVEQIPVPASGAPVLADLTLEQVKERWAEAVAVVRKKRVALGVFLAESEPRALNGKTLEIGFGPEQTFQMDAVRRNRDEIAAILRKEFGWDLMLKPVKADNVAVQPRANTPLARLQALEKLAEENPVVRKIMDEFEAELIL